MHVLIIGGGKTSYHLARKFISKGHHVTIVTRDPVVARRLARKVKAAVVVGDGSLPDVLEEAGARRAAVVVALQSADHDNLVTCQLAREMFGAPRTVALVRDPENVEVFQRLGVSVAISVAEMLAMIIEEQAEHDEIVNLAAMAKGRLNITELVLPRGAPAAGKHLRDLALPDNTLVAAIIRGNEVTVPRGDARLLPLDRVLLITQPFNHGAALKALVGEEL